MSNISGSSKLPNCVGDSATGIDSGDVAFMLLATTFVFLQTPFLGIAQAGLIRRKNALSMLLQTIAGSAIGSLLFFAVGFSLIFGPSSGGFIGGTQYFFLLGLSPLECMPNMLASDTIPVYLFAAFQLMFALMVPVIVTG